MTPPSDERTPAVARWFPWAFAAGVGLLTLLFYRDFVLHPDRMVYGTDLVDQAYQLREFAVTEVEAGRGIPLWNPYVYSGVPYVAILPGPVFYPTSLLYLVMPLFRAIGWTFLIHTFLAGMLGYFAGRTFDLDRWAAALTGLAFMFTGYGLSKLYGGHDGRMFAMVLIPAVFACLERGFRSGAFRWFFAAGIAVGLQILTPHMQVMYYSSLMAAAFASVRLAQLYVAGDGWRPVVKPTGYVVATFVLAAAFGAVQILPTLGMMEFGVRGGGLEGYEFASSWAIPPQELTALVLPDLVGSLREYWGRNPFKLHTEYMGGVALALALVAVVTRRRDRTVWFLAGASALGILFALGSATPVHRIGYHVIPLVSRFRAPDMMLAPVAFFVALLAGMGWQAVLDARRAGTREGSRGKTKKGGEAGGARRPQGEAGGPAATPPWGLLWALSAPVLLLGLVALLSPTSLQDWVYHSWFPTGWQREPSAGLASMLRTNGLLLLAGWSSVLLVGQAVASDRIDPRWVLLPMVLLVGELWRVDSRYLQTVPAAAQFTPDSGVREMQAGLAPGERVFPLEDSYGPNELMYWDVPSVTGSQNFRLAWYDRLVGGVRYDNLLRRPVLWPLLDIGYLTTRSPVDVPLLEPVSEGDGKRLYRVRHESPHAFFPRAVEGVGDTGEALRRTLEMQDPHEVAVVETSDVPAAGRGTARITEHRPDRVELEVRADEGGLLVVSEVYHPNWHAYVDDREVPVLRADAALRGVVVPSGEHRVTFRYRSTPFNVGLVLTLFAYGSGFLGLLVWTGRAVAGRGGSGR